MHDLMKLSKVLLLLALLATSGCNTEQDYLNQVEWTQCRESSHIIGEGSSLSGIKCLHLFHRVKTQERMDGSISVTCLCDPTRVSEVEVEKARQEALIKYNDSKRPIGTR